MWGCEGYDEVTIRHNSAAPARFLEEARPALLSYAESSTSRLIEGVQAAKAAVVAKDNDEAIDFLVGRSFSKKRALDIIEAVRTEEGREPRSAWDFANGITAVARTIPNADDRLTIELEAGKILDKVG